MRSLLNRSNLVEASKALSRRRDLESFFLECINEVRKERKLRGAPSTSLGKSNIYRSVLPLQRPHFSHCIRNSYIANKVGERFRINRERRGVSVELLQEDLRRFL